MTIISTAVGRISQKKWSSHHGRQKSPNNAITEIKITLQGTNSRITEAEDRINEVEDRMVEINEAERKREKNN